LIVAQLTWKYNFSTEMFQVMMILLGFFTILMLSPVENEKRKLKEQKRKKFRFFSIVFGGINVGCYAFGIFIECAPIKAATSLAMCIEMFLLLLALPQKLKNEMHDRNHGLDDRPL